MLKKGKQKMQELTNAHREGYCQGGGFKERNYSATLSRSLFLSLSLALSLLISLSPSMHIFLSHSPNGHDAGPTGSGHGGLENGLGGRLLLLQGVALPSHRPRHHQQALKH
mgnify:CR=1 FL=1